MQVLASAFFKSFNALMQMLCFRARARFFRFNSIDPDTGIETAQEFSEARKEVYPIHITVENKDGIQGSCALFKERTDVTQHVRSKSLAPLLNLQEALERFVELEFTEVFNTS